VDCAKTLDDLPPHRQSRSRGRTREQVDKARKLRHSPTDSEKAAWHLLRSIRFRGFKFRRQHPLGLYVVDFYCAQRRLVVELDGSVHGQPSQVRRDTRRDAHLKEMGYAVLRMPNGMVQEAPEVFVQKVLDAVWSLPEAFG